MRSLSPLVSLVLVVSLSPGALAQTTSLSPRGDGGDCTVVLVPPVITFSFGGGSTTATVTVTPEFGCGWEASTTSPWIHLEPSSGYGSGTFTVRVDVFDPPQENPCAPRAGEIRVENASIQVLQGAELSATCLASTFPRPSSNSTSCCATKAASFLTNGTVSLDLARRYRDEVLSATPRGRDLVRQYYTHTGEVVRIMTLDPWLTLRAARLFSRHDATLSAALDGGATVSRADLAEIDALLGEVEMAAGPDLSRALAAFRRDLETPDMLRVCRIAVRDLERSSQSRPLPPSEPFAGIGPSHGGRPAPMLRVPDLLALRARGGAYARWYLEHGDEARRLLTEDPVLALRAMSALGGLSAALSALVRAGGVDLSAETVASLDGLLDSMARRASPGFRNALEHARRDLANDRVLSGFGIRRPARGGAGRAAAAPLAFTRAPGGFTARGPGYGLGVDRTGIRLGLGGDGARAAMVRAAFAGAEQTGALVPEAPLATRVNDLVGSNPRAWRRAVETFERVVARDLYPGIDVRYRGTQRRLDLELHVAPFADPDQVRLRVDGARIAPDASGDLTVEAGPGAVTVRRPTAYQIVSGERRDVSAAFRVTDHGDVRLDLGAYDRSKELVVAPALDYAAKFGGAEEDGASDVALDTAGNIYLTGFASTAALPGATGAQSEYGGAGDAFVMKLDPTGTTVLYATYLGGRAQDLAAGIAVDEAGRAFIAGTTASSNFPRVRSLQPSLRGEYDGFVAELDETGSTLLFSTLLGGTMLDTASGIALDGTGDAVVCGATASRDFPTSTGAHTRSSRGLVDAFVAKIDTDAPALAYSTLLGGRNHDGASDVVVDAAGIAVVVGATASNDFPSANAAQPLFHGFVDGFVARVAADGRSLLSSTYFGGSGLDGLGGVALDASGAIYVTGATSSEDFPVVAPFQSTFGGGYLDAVSARLAPDAMTVDYATYLGGADDDRGYRIAVDAEARAYVAGITTSTNFPVKDAIQPVLSASSFDAFAVCLRPTGDALVYATYLGGTGEEAGVGVAVDAAGRAVFVGETSSADFPGAGAFAGAYDAFVARFAAPSNIPPPVVDEVAALRQPGKPFRLRITGSNFQEGVEVFIGGSATAWPKVQRKSAGQLILKKGPTLEALFPTGQAIELRIVNPDGGTARVVFTRD